MGQWNFSSSLSFYWEIVGDLPNGRILDVSENGVYPQNAGSNGKKRFTSGFRGTEFSGKRRKLVI